jgi:hypothetical protein
MAAAAGVLRADGRRFFGAGRRESGVRMIIRLIVLALSGYGAWKLYEQYGDRLPAMRGSFDEFSNRTASAAKDAADRVGSAADDATSAIRDSASDISAAARDAQEDMTRTLRDTPSPSSRGSY